jgi:hypothetical protein
MTETATSHPVATGDRGERRPRRAVVMVVAVLALLVGTITAVAISNHRSQAYVVTQIVRMQDACQTWAHQMTGATHPDDAWCSSMAAWMNGRVNGSPGGAATMIGSAMWQTPDAMRQTCQEWVATSDVAPAGTSGIESCQQMVGWMQANMGDWNDWMMTGAMMR